MAASRAGALGFLAGGYKTAAGSGRRDGGRPCRRGRRVRREPLRPGRPDGRSRGAGRLRRAARARRGRRRRGPRARRRGTTTTTPASSTRSWRHHPPRSASPSGSLRSTSCGAAGGGLRRPVDRHDARRRRSSALPAGPDALCLQGAEAGAHRGSLANDDRPDEDRPVRALLAAVRRRTLVPLVAAGGVGGPEDVADLLVRGADLVQAGTAFLRCPESGAPVALKDALAGSAAFGVDRHHPCLQRPAGARARQRHGAGASALHRLRTPRSTTRRVRCAPRRPERVTRSA